MMASTKASIFGNTVGREWSVVLASLIGEIFALIKVLPSANVEMRKVAPVEMKMFVMTSMLVNRLMKQMMLVEKECHQIEQGEQ